MDMSVGLGPVRRPSSSKLPEKSLDRAANGICGQKPKRVRERRVRVGETQAGLSCSRAGSCNIG